MRIRFQLVFAAVCLTLFLGQMGQTATLEGRIRALEHAKDAK